MRRDRLDPRDAPQGGPGMSMEGYLGNLFNHGAVMVKIFGWGLGDKDYPFRRIAESPDALAAYRKFLSGGQPLKPPFRASSRPCRRDCRQISNCGRLSPNGCRSTAPPRSGATSTAWSRLWKIGGSTTPRKAWRPSSRQWDNKRTIKADKPQLPSIATPRRNQTPSRKPPFPILHGRRIWCIIKCRGSTSRKGES